MKILFDQGTPVPLRTFLDGHTVETAFEKGWSELINGDLLDKAEEEGFNLMITTDQSLRYQQNIDGRRIALIVLKTTSWNLIKSSVERVVEALERCDRQPYQEFRF